MQVTFDTVTRMTIKDERRRIWVFLENVGPGQGRLTVSCDGDVWSYYWGAMGKSTPTLETFIPDCDSHYVTKKLAPQLRSHIEDVDTLVGEARKEIIRCRMEDGTDKQHARYLYDRAEELESGIEENQELLSDIFGDEWWYGLPQKPNPEYEYLKGIVETVQKALRQTVKEKV